MIPIIDFDYFLYLYIYWVLYFVLRYHLDNLHLFKQATEYIISET